MMQRKQVMSPLAVILILSSVFFVLFLLISGLMVFYNKSPMRISHGGASASLFREGAVGVIELKGVILDSKKTLNRLERFEEDDQIKAVVLRLNSPGGAVAPSQEIYEAVKNYKKPLVVSMASLAASGAYYIACGAKKVFANPGTLTGSIGVIMEFADLRKLYDWAKIHRYSIKTGPYKDIGAEYRSMTDEERKLLQGVVNDTLSQFKHAVAEGRHLTLEQVSKVADGRIFSGSQAKFYHLVDELGTLNDAINDAAQLAHLKGKPPVVYFEKSRRGWLDLMMDDSQSSDENSVSSLEFLTLLKRFFLLFEGQGSGVGGDSVSSEIPLFTPGIYWIWGNSASSHSLFLTR
jgi:protease-4